MARPTPSLLARCVAETLGTFILVFLGCGAVHSAVLTGSLQGLFQVAIVWGIGVTLAIYVVGSISGAHINPAMTVALVVWKKAPGKCVVPYVASQLIGGFLAAAVLFVFFQSQLAAKERKPGKEKEDVAVERGQAGSEITAMCYGEYFPDPSAGDNLKLYRAGDADGLVERVNPAIAFAIELICTMLLALVVFAVTDDRNAGRPTSNLAPVFIGLTVTVLICVVAPLTQACFNPARDFGPRLFAASAGWGTVALPGPNGIHCFTVYIVAPIVEAVLGGGLYERVLRPCLSPPADELHQMILPTPDSRRTQ